MKFLAIAVALAGLATAACGQQPTAASDDGDAVRERAQEAQTAKRQTGAELQDRTLNRVIRTVYLCDNSERLSVDFDNPRQMATVRNSTGEAVDLFQERTADGLWYKASGHELRGKGVMATWTADGRPPTTCRALD